ncbi:hypothetical protein [Nonomuraea basaltis]|uniref:hypothetical protein n=1 Tax=Nonomuraea basaltis TaxID=2495887 RepID=UPI00110C57C4|nr:hypothetical protein [Nonomuraea basaltis]TMR98058.1 hypothetical protein EJK15_14640 [Nonomuraea basaltis]
MRRLPWRSALAAVAVAVAVVWVIDPLALPGERPIQFLRPELPRAASAPKPQKLSKYASPVRYAYVPACQDGSGPCANWNLVTAGGERGWLPGADAAGSLALSQDGTRAAYLRGKDERYVVADLRTGTLTPLPVRQKGGSVGEIFGAQPPLFSLDGRHLLIQLDRLDKDDETVLERPMIVDIDRGAVHRLPATDRVVGWTDGGLLVVTSKRTAGLPGHVTKAKFTVYSPQGKAVRTFTLPGNLTYATVPSPSGRTLASPVHEITPYGVADFGVTLIDTSSGRPVRTIVPGLPAGWRIREIVRWDGEDALVVKSSGPYNETGHHVLDLATGGMRPIGADMSDVADLPLQPAGLGVVVANVR